MWNIRWMALLAVLFMLAGVGAVWGEAPIKGYALLLVSITVAVLSLHDTD